MTAGNALRVVTLFVFGVTAGATAATHVPPRSFLLVAGQACWAGALFAAVVDRLGRPVELWVTPLVLAGSILWLAGLLRTSVQVRPGRDAGPVQRTDPTLSHRTDKKRGRHRP